MNTSTRLRIAAFLALLAFAGNSGSAFAQISASGVGLAATQGTNSLAFDSVNGVYLQLTTFGSVIRGQFVNAQGTAVGGTFNVTDEPISSAMWVAWYSTVCGGTSSDPVFLVTYLIDTGSGSHEKYARMIRYRAGTSPQISARSFVANTGRVFMAAEMGRNAWDGDQFVTGTYMFVNGSTTPQPIVHHVSTSGVVSGGVVLGDYLDYYGVPSVACSPATKVCMVVGFAGGTPKTGVGGSYMRLFDGNSLQPLTSMDYVDFTYHAEDQSVVFNAGTGQFLVTWLSYRPGYWIDHRIISTDGSKGTYDTSLGVGPGAGEARVAYNAATGTSLLVAKLNLISSRPYDFYALELGDSGAPIRPANVLHLMECWDGKDCPTPVFNTGIAANPSDGSWLLDMWYGAHSWRVQGTTGGTPPPPPPPPPATPTLSKSAPSNGATGQATSVSLSWGAVTGATEYRYCYDTTNNSACDGSYVSAGTSTSAQISGLGAGTTYYWQAQATVSGSPVTADSGTWWNFTTSAAVTPPAAFGKTAPTTGTTLTGNSTTLSWRTASGASYRVCLDTTNNGSCNVAWTSTGASTTLPLAGLPPGTYYWQVQAVTTSATDGDSGAWWSFTVPAAAFSKTAPADNAAGLGSAVSLTWSSLSGASGYSYCVSRVATGCDSLTGWVDTGATSAGISLGAGTYYWHVVSSRGVNSDNGSWKAFTVGARTSTLTKTAPATGTSGASSPLTLSWSAVSGATYEVCVDTTDDSACNAGWMKVGTATSTTLDSVPAGIYYWQVRATTTTRQDADNGTWWSFATAPPVDPRVIDVTATVAPNGSWVFSEGALGLTWGFSTYYEIANENTGPAHVRAWIVKVDDANLPVTFVETTVPALTRKTLDLSALVGGEAGWYSAVFQSVPSASENIPSGRQVYIARAMYWSGTSGVLTGPGHTKTGLFVPSGGTLPKQWYFAEGTRVSTPGGGAFNTFYSIFNPTQQAASVTVEFLGDAGAALATVPISIPAQSRWSISANSIGALAGANFSARITSDTGVLAERVMYWGTNWSAGHVAIGSSTTANDWYLAEGTAMPNFGTYYLLLNPNASPVSVDVTYHLSPVDGVPQTPVIRTHLLPANSRTTIFLGYEVSGTQTGVASEFHVTSGGGIVVERSMYWGANWTEGSTGMATPSPAVEWHLPSGSTMSGFETYVLLSNPNTSAVTVTVTTVSDAGTELALPLSVPAKSRLTLYMNNQNPGYGPVFGNIPADAFATSVIVTGSSLPIVAEQAVYWGRINAAGEFWRGGDATLGAPVIRR